MARRAAHVTSKALIVYDSLYALLWMTLTILLSTNIPIALGLSDPLSYAANAVSAMSQV